MLFCCVCVCVCSLALDARVLLLTGYLISILAGGRQGAEHSWDRHPPDIVAHLLFRKNNSKMIPVY